jgi:2'-5' RNA ligase
MRMFVAIDLDDRARAAAAEAQQLAARLTGRSSIRFVDPQRAHLTLAFLGEIPAPQSDRVIDAMQASIDGVRPFRMAFGSLGIFPPRGAPRVLWLGVSEGARDIIALQHAVAARLAGLGVSLEDRAFHPHLTLGRWKQARPSDRPPLDAAAPAPAGAMTVDRVTLYESRLSSEGPAHIALAHALLYST